MSQFKKLNVIIGWIVWAIASFVYLGTMEPTTSFWDCGEFIATAYKLEVGHPPGAPLFMLIARMFGVLGGSPENAAMMINALSALSSSFTILFLFWTITIFGRKLALKGGSEWDQGKMIAVLGSGIVGALAYTFSDSFWFSAVEGEVYALSSLFTAATFYAMLKWESVADQPHNTRWIVLIAYFIGLSIGVHLLSLLTIPAITFIYYFKRYDVTRKGIIITAIIAVGLLGVVQYGIIPGVVQMATYFELMFVNGMGMPFNTGTIVYGLLMVGLIIFGLKYTHEKGKVVLNTVILCFTVIVIGYSSFAIIVIRSAANTPMDENNPENVFSLLSYLNREQYGDKPLVYGPSFNTPQDAKEPFKDGKPVYWQSKEDGKYIIVDDKKNAEPNYNSDFKILFPRMWSPQGKHKTKYKWWTDFKGKPTRTKDNSGKAVTINKVTMGENLTFFVRYQLGWMWWRYFMWNYAGRQTDVQGHGNIVDGNWISGIKILDEWRLGNQDELPQDIVNNKAHNKFYLLPFILGLIGMFFQFSNSRNNAIVVTLLFVFTGIAILVFLNNYPLEPRERDYAIVGSCYAFAIWIGLGVYGIYESLKKYTSGQIAAGGSTLVCLLMVPGLMAAEGWDDHSRAKRFTGRDYAKNYLNSCAPNAILFTNGDNDTFPLWYVQEVEEYRTDVRVVNLSLSNTDWYIEQMKRKAYDSDPIPSQVPANKYRQGTNDYLPIYEKFKTAKPVDQIIEWVVSENAKTKIPVSSGKFIDYIPTKQLALNVDKQKVLELGVVGIEDTANIVDQITWKIRKNYILKNDLMILDILATNKWERPVYFASTAPSDSYLGLEEYFQVEGLAYRLVPIKTKKREGQPGRVATDVAYENVMNKFNWGGLDENNVYMDENNRRMTISHRILFSRLAESLISQNRNEDAKMVLDKCMTVVPKNNVPYDIFSLYLAEAYYKIGENDKANEIVLELVDLFESKMIYYNSLDRDLRKTLKSDMNQAGAVLQRILYVTTQQFPQGEMGDQLYQRLSKYFGEQQNQVPR